MEQIEAELRWLSLRLRVAVERGRRRRALGPPEEYRGLYISDEEVEHLLSAGKDGSAPIDIANLVQEAAALRRALDQRAEAALAAGLDLPLERITRVFGLRPAERLILIVGLGPYVDAGYEKVYAYANDDIARKRPTVGLALDVLSDEGQEALALRPLFYSDAPLSRHRLTTLVGDSGSGSSPLLSQPLELDSHVAEVLLGFDGLDPRLYDAAELAPPPEDGLEVGEQLARVLRQRRDARVYLASRWHAEKQAAAVAACCLVGMRMIAVHTPALQQTGTAWPLLPLLFRDARLLHAALYFSDWDARGEGDAETTSLSAAMRPLLRDHPLPVFFSGRGSTMEVMPATLHLQLELAPPTHAERKRHWDEAEGGSLAHADTGHLAATFRFGSQEIRSAAWMARSLADWRGADSISLEDLKMAARFQSQPRLTMLAHKILPHFTWADIVLPPDRLAQLREIAVQVLYQHVVYDEWGFASKTSLGRGVNVLFAGQSGTGKTMAAEIIAHELGLDLYKIDLSGLVSKYIGETEKNLARVFDEAGDTNAILFFDEADAVFGKRTEVRDSHDRYANIEVSYLLQKMEEYDGIVVLASNLRANIDEAFLRRVRAIVEFPFPEEQDRLRIWERTLSASAPIADDVELEFMARQFRIAGGNIKNIVLLAAFLAAEEGEPIGMAHLIRATKREYQKLGRLISESDFAGWFDEVKV
jgi:hypothetical protein